ncbi:hypothetical protein GQ44DRAFT_720264 [Phaeosphaeriaceae sp. PMI808]|nr:hypothetical protein GQ44DRAFT_720264 [Phaeosphaeriaceae sp. PMI808]
MGLHMLVVRMLLEKDADVNAQGGEYGTALRAASWGGHDTVVRMLLEKNADVNEGNCGGEGAGAADDAGCD